MTSALAAERCVIGFRAMLVISPSLLKLHVGSWWPVGSSSHLLFQVHGICNRCFFFQPSSSQHLPPPPTWLLESWCVSQNLCFLLSFRSLASMCPLSLQPPFQDVHFSRTLYGLVDGRLTHNSLLLHSSSMLLVPCSQLLEVTVLALCL